LRDGELLVPVFLAQLHGRIKKNSQRTTEERQREAESEI
jgi:hypothetical protein